MQKQIPGKLLATVAASAASVAPFAATNAIAADPYDQAAIDTRLNFAFEGAALWSDSEDDKVGSLDKLGNDGNFRAYAEVSRKYDTDLDWRLGGAVFIGNGSDTNFMLSQTEGDVYFSSGSGFNFQTLDFDLGKHVNVGKTDVRMFGGVRLLHSRERFDFDVELDPIDALADKSGTIDKVGTSDFWGIGPRIGAEAYHDMGSNWGLTGSLSGSAMWGRRHSNLDLEVHTYDPDDVGDEATDVSMDFTDNSYEVVTNVEATAGVMWQFMPGKSVTAGYRIESWQNLRGIFSDNEGDVFHGPFLRVDVKM
jgi:hypothetical protein